ncbi:hypothetical protein NDN08_002709 [Rhodosorus marinus]|uniref:RRM domain-containing protein n=1 Tax=Rhodosorus marinus TaxID=101924 RepID=A0AAV8UUH3_9RHOD|nr:hypothetical protein NDN08_002709 [Rhodosorus marinus]
MAEEEIVVQNPKLMEWMSQELLKGSFEGEADALAKYIIALLETYALDDPGFETNATIKGKCVDDLADFLGDDTTTFVDSLFKELVKNPLRTGPETGIEAEPSPSPDEDTNEVTPEPDLVDETAGRNRREEEEEKRRRRSERFGVDLQDAPKTSDEDRRGKSSRRESESRGGNNRENRESRQTRDARTELDKSRGRDGRDQRENREGDRKRQRNDGDRGKNEVVPPGQPPFPPMALGGFPPALMEMMAMAAAQQGNPNAGIPPPNPFLGVPFGTGAGFLPGVQDSERKDMIADPSRRRGQTREPFVPRGRGRGQIPRGAMQGSANDSVRPANMQKGTTLLVRNLPPESLKLPAIAEYFSKFGNVSNIQLRPPANPERAFIEFSTHEEAQKAMDSVEAVMGNRHVRLHWARDGDYNAQNPAEGMPQNQGADSQRPFDGGMRGRGRGRRGRGRGDAFVYGGPKRADYHMEHEGGEAVAGDTGGDGAQQNEANPEANEAPKESPEEVNARKRKELLAVREEQKKRKVEKEKVDSDNKKRLVIEQMKKIQLLENGKETMTPEEKKKVVEELKQIAASLETQNSKPKPQRAQGSNLDALEAKLTALKREAEDLGIDPSVTSTSTHRGGRGKFRGRGSSYPYRGGFRGRGRGRGFHAAPFAPGNMSLDLRPRELLIQGVGEDSGASRTRIRGGFQNVETIEPAGDGAFMIKFQSRAAAEAAMKQGPAQLGTDVSLTWPGGKESEGDLPEDAAEKDAEDGNLQQYAAAGVNESEEIQVDYEEE